jgi:hypothetical protein
MGVGGPVLATTSVRIGATDVTPFVVTENYRITEELNGRNTLEMELLIDINVSDYFPQEGEEVVLTIGANRAFAGTVHEFDADFITEGNLDWRHINVRCTDWNQLADRHIVAEVYDQLPVGLIVKDILFRHLTEDGVQIGNILDGPSIQRAVFAYITVSEALDQLSEQTGRFWNIDYYKILHFVEPDVTEAPLTITQDNSVIRRFKKSRSLSQYRNVEYIDGGKGITIELQETFKGDGTERSWNTEYPVAEMIEIKIGSGLNNSIQSVSVRSGGTGEFAQFYYALNETSISQDHDETVVAEGTQVFVRYRGFYPIINVTIDQTKIADRKLIEGGSGKYEHIERNDELDGEEVVEAKAIGLLRKFGLVDTTIQFETDVTGLAIGYVATVDIPKIGISDTEFLITRIEIENYRKDRRRYTVNATTGELKGTMREFFLKLFNGPRKLTINPDQIVGRGSPFDIEVQLSDSLTVTQPAYTRARCGSAVIGACSL